METNNNKLFPCLLSGYITIFSYLRISVLHSLTDNSEDVVYKFSLLMLSVFLPVLSLLIQAGHVPKSARHPRNVGFSEQPFLLHALLGTFHVKTSAPVTEKEKKTGLKISKTENR